MGTTWLQFADGMCEGVGSEILEGERKGGRSQTTMTSQQLWAWKHYQGEPVCKKCKRLDDCPLSPTSACSLFEEVDHP